MKSYGDWIKMNFLVKPKYVPVIILFMVSLYIGYSAYCDDLHQIPDYIMETYHNENGNLVRSITYQNPEKQEAWVLWFFVCLFYIALQCFLIYVVAMSLYYSPFFQTNKLGEDNG